MPTTKNLILIRGPVGAGKTSVVEALRNKLNDVSIIDFDAFKRQIDNTQSSEWRRRIALNTALYLCQQLMNEDRTIVVDIHSCFRDQYEHYVALAKQNSYRVSSYLIYPPLQTCLQRAGERIVPDISYAIDATMIKKYWKDTFLLKGEPIYDDPSMTAKDIATAIMNTHQKTAQ
ncbi:MAG: AAA family ATPase [Candidatus Saccharimonadota bacterium]|jgi:predicted kinase